MSYEQRFGGIARLYGTSAQSAIRSSHILVIGLGGVGSWSAEALVRTGVGHISLMDLDDICITNTNRQVHTLQSTIGSAKTEALRDRLQQINPECEINVIDDFLSQDNIESYITSDYSLVIDAIDLMFTKAALIAHCKRRKIPIITTGSSGGKKDPTQITYGDLGKTRNDPLLAKVRNTLRRHYNFSRNNKRSFGIEAIYSTEQLTYPNNQGETCQSKQFLDSTQGLDCNSGFGSVSMVTASVGLLAASRGLEKIIAKSTNKASQQPQTI